jgi:hypothetical protein
MTQKDKTRTKRTKGEAVQLSDDQLDAISGGPAETKTVLENGAGKFKIEIDGAPVAQASSPRGRRTSG